jgi:hypothetical protein
VLLWETLLLVSEDDDGEEEEDALAELSLCDAL